MTGLQNLLLKKCKVVQRHLFYKKKKLKKYEEIFRPYARVQDLAWISENAIIFFVSYWKMLPIRIVWYWKRGLSFEFEPSQHNTLWIVRYEAIFTFYVLRAFLDLVWFLEKAIIFFRSYWKMSRMRVVWHWKRSLSFESEPSQHNALKIAGYEAIFTFSGLSLIFGKSDIFIWLVWKNVVNKSCLALKRNLKFWIWALPTLRFANCKVRSLFYVFTCSPGLSLIFGKSDNFFLLVLKNAGNKSCLALKWKVKFQIWALPTQ